VLQGQRDTLGAPPARSGPSTRELLRTRPSPLTWDQARRLCGARPVGPPPRPSAEPITVQRRASNTGVIMVAGQKIALGRIHAGQIVNVHVAEHTMTIDLGGDDTRTIRRTTTQSVRSIKAHRPRRRPGEPAPAASHGGSPAPDCSQRAHPQEAGSQ